MANFFKFFLGMYFGEIAKNCYGFFFLSYLPHSSLRSISSAKEVVCQTFEQFCSTYNKSSVTMPLKITRIIWLGLTDNFTKVSLDFDIHFSYYPFRFTFMGCETKYS